jgi:hypothetical protein
MIRPAGIVRRDGELPPRSADRSDTLVAASGGRHDAMTIDAKPIARAALASGALLLIPLAAMLVADDVAWSPFDFAFMGALLFGTSLAFELLARRAASPAQRAGFALALAAGLLLVWVNASVGILGAPGGPNVLYLGVLAVGLAGALWVRLRPARMAWPLFAMAIVQLLVPPVALVVAGPERFSAPPGAWGVLVLNAGFAVAFAAAGALFRGACAPARRPA